MIARLKWGTQRLTTLLFALLFCGIPFVFAQLLAVSGGVRWVDGMYDSQILFWVLMAVSRLAYAIVCVNLFIWLVNKAEEHGWFWVNHSGVHVMDTNNPDISGTVIFYLTAALVSEFVIRLFTQIPAPYPHS